MKNRRFIVLGGSRGLSPHFARVSNCDWSAPEFRSIYLGLRLVRKQ